MLDKVTAMTAPLGDLRTIEKFLFHEVQLLDERRFEIMADNCRAFGAGHKLRNQVDKASWF